MGFLVTDKTANFSSLGFGSILPEENYIINAGITNPIYQAAIRAFYVNLRAGGLLSKFKLMRMYFAGTALADSINMVSPYLGTVNNQATFVNDAPAAHVGGYTPNSTAGRYEKTGYYPNGNMNLVHVHAWNTTPAATDNAQKYLAFAGSSTSGEDYQIVLQRRAGTYSKALLSKYTAAINTTSANNYDTQRTGLLSASRQAGGLTKLYDDAGIIGSLTASDVPILSGLAEMKVGAPYAGAALQYADCTLRFFGIGFSAWTDQDEINLNNYIKTFNAAIA